MENDMLKKKLEKLIENWHKERFVFLEQEKKKSERAEVLYYSGQANALLGCINDVQEILG